MSEDVLVLEDEIDKLIDKIAALTPREAKWLLCILRHNAELAYDKIEWLEK